MTIGATSGKAEQRDRADVAHALGELLKAEQARQRAIAQLIELGAIRGRGLVGELGEAIAAAYYGVRLAPPSTPGFDLISKEGAHVQVRTLRSTSYNWRIRLGRLRGDYDLVFAIRLGEDFYPTAAIEFPRSVVEELFGDRVVLWRKELEGHPLVRRIEAADLGVPGIPPGDG